jgi:hypothetical protein
MLTTTVGSQPEHHKKGSTSAWTLADYHVAVDISDIIWMQRASRIKISMVQHHAGQQRKLWLIPGSRESSERCEAHLTTRGPIRIGLNLIFLSSFCRFPWEFTATTMIQLAAADHRAYGSSL